MPIRLMPSDPKFSEMDSLAWMLVVLKNPAIHLLGYGHGDSPIERAINRACDDSELDQAIQAVEQAQSELISLSSPAASVNTAPQRSTGHLPSGPRPYDTGAYSDYFGDPGCI